jgi:Chitobiase/beta-hexosaminidase C-terminal domain/Bacterial Ig-like domain (group 2)
MNKSLALLFLGMGVPAMAATYTVAAGSSAATIQSIVNSAGSASGNTVAFSAGAYRLAATVTLPCAHGTIYTGPNAGVVTQSNLPTAVLTSTNVTSYALATDSNGTSFTTNAGCTVQYLRFSGTQGGIIVSYPSSGITIQENAFDNNNPPAGGSGAKANIFLDGRNGGFSPSTGVQHISVTWNTFFNNCAAIRAVAWPDSGGLCAATWVNGYNNYLTWSNNTINLIEEGLKLSEQNALGIASLNADVENNNMQGNSRILIESQQDTNGIGIYSHNSFYQPFNPSFNTFELSIPEYTPSISPTHTASDNVFIGNVPITLGGQGAHYGIGLELWGAGSIATYNLFQGGNGADTCAAGYGCTGWVISVGEAFTDAKIMGNYFSGTDAWSGKVNEVSRAVTYEDSGSVSNRGMVLSPNTVVQTSTTIATTAPSISAASGASAATVTLSDGDTTHGLSIFYTTDGTTPAVFRPGSSAGTTRVYTGPFTVPKGVTVKALASWGQGANQGVVFPSFGYVPSKVVPVVIAGQGRSLLRAALRPKVATTTAVTGGTVQFVAYGTYSDGSVGTLPDAQGNTVTAWNTTNHAIAKVSSQGHMTAVGAGKVNIEAMIGSLNVSPWAMTISAKTAPNVAGAVADSQASLAADAQAAANGAATQAAVGADAQGTDAQGTDAQGTDAQGATSTEPAAAAAAATTTQAGSGAGSQSTLVPPKAPVAGPVPAAPAAAAPDRFLGPFWRVVTPTGGSASISNSHLFIGVPGGANHDALSASNQAVRVVQAIDNEDFDVSVKIDSPLVAADGNTRQGLMVLSDSEDFVTFALETDGNSIGLGADTVAHGVPTTVLADKDFSQYQNPMYLRLSKTGSAYVALYSIDGSNWTQAASFTDTRASTWVGPFASNYSDTPANAVPVVMSVNWFDVRQ